MSAGDLIPLEEALAHQAAQLDELNAVVTAQAALIDKLQRQVALLMARAAEAEAAQPGQALFSDPPPPHY